METSLSLPGLRSGSDKDGGRRIVSLPNLFCLVLGAEEREKEEEEEETSVAKGLSDFTQGNWSSAGPHPFGEYQFGGRDLSRQPVENKCGASCNFLHVI